MTGDIRALEHRTDRSYDESDPATIMHPNGTRMATFDRALAAALTREVLDLHDQTREAR